ncbi:MAG TPA: dTDP-4-dehydrorhamnose 3,5-epimerase [Methylomirabilota bacterium]|nr:dTDP-4-dehydrorhamnose 3,5-epimerase [Methylomirabilota bacterium]
MKLLPTPIPGVVQVELQPQTDERGSFARTYCEATFRAHGLEPVGVQCNVSVNPKRGTLRGLHFQAPPAEEAKLVRCARGWIFDVAVDLRRDSPTFRQWFGVELDGERGNGLYIPRGCAHGFLTLADDTVVDYRMGAAYVAELARGVRWNDPAFAIAWPFAPLHIGERDAAYPDFVA